MTARLAAEERYGADRVAGERYLPERFDASLSGEAFRAGHRWTPIYNLGAVIEKHGGDGLRELVRLDDANLPLLLVQPHYGSLWERVQTHRLFAWELMNPAIVGLASWGIQRSHAIVYDLQKVLAILFTSTASSKEISDSDKFLDAKHVFDTKMGQLDCGDPTPWYIRFRK